MDIIAHLSCRDGIFEHLVHGKDGTIHQIQGKAKALVQSEAVDQGDMKSRIRIRTYSSVGRRRLYAASNPIVGIWKAAAGLLSIY
jgi:hypothetical protein